MAEEDKSDSMCNPHINNGNFICGVVEGTYNNIHYYARAKLSLYYTVSNLFDFT